MTVCELIKRLSEYNEDAPVVLSGGDHHYFDIGGAQEVDAEPHKNVSQFDPPYSEWYEDCGQGEPVKVVVIY